VLPEDSLASTIAGALPVIVAALLRVRERRPAVAPNPDLGTAADLLRMLAGTPAEDKLAVALDAYLTTVIDNGLGHRLLPPGSSSRRVHRSHPPCSALSAIASSMLSAWITAAIARGLASAPTRTAAPA
jgi:citrate synthase